MSLIYTPHEYQKIALDFLIDTPRAALFAGMGMGKTLIAISLLDALQVLGDGSPALVLGPLRVARDTWATETGKWRDFKDSLIVSPIIGDPWQRAQALKRPAQIYTINYENIAWLREQFDKRPWPFKTVIADESTRLKGHRTVGGGKRAAKLAAIARQTDRWINLTGTPAPNGLKDLWGQYWFLDFGKRLGSTYTAFCDRWFRPKWSGFGIEPLPHSDREIHERINDITLSIRPEDWFDLKDPIRKDIRVQMGAEHLKRYKQLERDLFTRLASGEEIEVFNAGAMTNKCLQYANGAVYTDKLGNWSTCHDRKLEALESIIEESGGAQVLVSYEFVSDRLRILDRIKSSVDISTPKGMADFMQGRKQVGVAHPKSMGHGIDGLQKVCNILVYFGHGWDLELRDQILERIGPVRQMQAGLDRPVWVYSIITDDTLDDAVIDRHRSKRSVQDALRAAMVREAA